MSSISTARGGRFDIPDSTTPREITEEIMKLCRQLDPTQTPIYVPVRPPANSMVDSCFYNLPDKIKADGGSAQHGWTIWERPGLLIEGEFHAVWVSPEGEFIDITPKVDGETEILFLPDSRRVWTGELVDNVRMPLVDNEITRLLVKSSKEQFAIRQKHFKGGPRIEIPFMLLDELNEGYALPQQPRPKVGRNDPCPCGSRKKYKKCCGR